MMSNAAVSLPLIASNKSNSNGAKSSVALDVSIYVRDLLL